MRTSGPWKNLGPTNASALIGLPHQRNPEEIIGLGPKNIKFSYLCKHPYDILSKTCLENYRRWEKNIETICFKIAAQLHQDKLRRKPQEPVGLNLINFKLESSKPTSLVSFSSYDVALDLIGNTFCRTTDNGSLLWSRSNVHCNCRLNWNAVLCPSSWSSSEWSTESLLASSKWRVLRSAQNCQEPYVNTKHIDSH